MWQKYKILKRLQNPEKILWTDSQCVLQWIKNGQNISIFVRNQIIEIINEIDVEFQSINTKNNSADVPTLGISAKELENNKLRWHGPK